VSPELVAAVDRYFEAISTSGRIAHDLSSAVGHAYRRLSRGSASAGGTSMRPASPSLIRYYMSEGHDLVNKQGTLINRHEVVSSQVPMRIVPRRMYLESRR
jgi:hypothetical protein